LFTALTLGASGTAATACDLAGGAVNDRGWGLGPAVGNGNAFGSTTMVG
jgi:hypothetical protein